MWSYLSGAAAASPRTEMMIGTEVVTQKVPRAKPVTAPGWSGALIVGAFKIVIGVQSYGFWQGPVYPNATTDHNAEVVDQTCGETGCLFNIQDDPSEYVNLAASNPSKLGELMARFVELNKTAFEAPRAGCFTKSSPKCAADIEACTAKVEELGNFYGPYAP